MVRYLKIFASISIWTAAHLAQSAENRANSLELFPFELLLLQGKPWDATVDIRTIQRLDNQRLSFINKNLSLAESSITNQKESEELESLQNRIRLALAVKSHVAQFAAASLREIIRQEGYDVMMKNYRQKIADIRSKFKQKINHLNRGQVAIILNLNQSLQLLSPEAKEDHISTTRDHFMNAELNIRAKFEQELDAELKRFAKITTQRNAQRAEWQIKQKELRELLEGWRQLLSEVKAFVKKMGIEDKNGEVVVDRRSRSEDPLPSLREQAIDAYSEIISGLREIPKDLVVDSNSSDRTAEEDFIQWATQNQRAFQHWLHLSDIKIRNNARKLRLTSNQEAAQNSWLMKPEFRKSAVASA